MPALPLSLIASLSRVAGPQPVDAVAQIALDLEVPDPHLYFQAPGGQVWRLDGVDEDLSKYEGNDDLAASVDFVRRAP